MTSIGKDSGDAACPSALPACPLLSCGCVSAATIGAPIKANAMMNAAAEFCFGVIREKVNFRSESRAKAMP
jgi:hypothetical protein